MNQSPVIPSGCSLEYVFSGQCLLLTPSLLALPAVSKNAKHLNFKIHLCHFLFPLLLGPCLFQVSFLGLFHSLSVPHLMLSSEFPNLTAYPSYSPHKAKFPFHSIILLRELLSHTYDLLKAALCEV
jgi:hypothetical protein